MAAVIFSRCSAVVVAVLVLATLAATVRAASHSDAKRELKHDLQQQSLTNATAAAVYSDQDVAGGLRSAWGHNDTAVAGAVQVSEQDLAQIDVLRGLRDHSPSESCRKAIDAVLQAELQLKLWALKMHSSSVHLPDVLVTGTIFDLGDYDGCLAVPGAMYCLLDVEVRPAVAGDAQKLHVLDEVSPFEPPHGVNATMWDLLQVSGNRRRFRRDLQHWAVCVPEECGRAAGGQLDGRLLGAALADTVSGLARSLAVDLRLHLDDKACKVAGDDWASLRQRLNDPVFVIGSVILLSFPVLVVIASVRLLSKKHSKNSDDGCAQTDPDKNTGGFLSRFLDCFAAQGTWKQLNGKDETEIHAIQGMRTWTIIFVILGHRCFSIMSGPLKNPEFFESAFTKVLGMYLINGTVVVTTFFVISGFLDSRRYMSTRDKLGKRFNTGTVLTSYIFRYLRMAPALGVVLAIEALWARHLGSGPLWYKQAGLTSEHCSAAWWAHMLFINNYFGTSSCMIQTWFLAADMQMHLASPLVMWLVYRLSQRSVGRACSLLAGLLLLSAAVLYANNVLLNLDHIVHVLPAVMHGWNVGPYTTFLLQYIPAHTNAIPYVIGLMAGTLLHLADRHEWKAPQWLRTALWAGIPVGHLLQTACFFSGVMLYTAAFTQASPLLTHLYAPARMLLFSLPTAWIILSCAMGFGGMFSWLLTWPPFVALGRLTYSVFLVHFTFINIKAGLLRQPEYFNGFNLVVTVLSDIFASYLLGLLLHITVEAPTRNLQKRLLNKTIAHNYPDDNPTAEDEVEPRASIQPTFDSLDFPTFLDNSHVSTSRV